MAEQINLFGQTPRGIMLNRAPLEGTSGVKSPLAGGGGSAALPGGGTWTPFTGTQQQQSSYQDYMNRLSSGGVKGGQPEAASSVDPSRYTAGNLGLFYRNRGLPTPTAAPAAAPTWDTQIKQDAVRGQQTAPAGTVHPGLGGMSYIQLANILNTGQAQKYGVSDDDVVAAMNAVKGM